MKQNHSISRRALLQWLAITTAAATVPQLRHAAPRAAPRRTFERLREELTNLIGTLEIALDLRRIGYGGAEDWRIQINADELYPVASCFKMFLLLYYFWNTPQDEWETGEYSLAHSTAVFSNNMTTSWLLQNVALRSDVFGNPVQKFNDFLLFTLEMENGLYSWNWPDSPTEGMTDSRFESSPQRVVDIYGQVFRMDNLMTAAELAEGYAILLQPDPFPDEAQSRAAIAATLDLFAIPAEAYASPIERAFGTNYIGKDGVLPAADSAIGRVINDAGIIEVNGVTYVIAYMCAGEGEFVAINVLAEIASLLYEYQTEQ